MMFNNLMHKKAVVQGIMQQKQSHLDQIERLDARVTLLNDQLRAIENGEFTFDQASNIVFENEDLQKQSAEQSPVNHINGPYVDWQALK